MGLSQAQTYVMLVSMIFAGAANTIVYNLQNSSTTIINGHDYGFQHPFMQGVTMFVGEFLMIFMFMYFKTKNKVQYEQELEVALAKGLSNKPIKYLFLGIPSMCDFFTSCLQYVALTLLPPSIYQMLRGGVVLITAAMSVLFLGRKLQNFHLLGCFLVFGGVCLVGAANFIFPESSESKYTAAGQTVGIILILISLLFNGGLFVSEEKLFGVFTIQPFEMVGTEGGFGLLYYCIALPILCTAHCTFGDNICVTYPIGTTPHYDSFSEYFEQFAHNGGLAALIIIGIFTIAVFNVCGVMVTKYISALARSIADVSRTVLVWIISLIITFTAGKNNEKYAWENTNWRAILIELVGFLILVSGNLIYNKIVILPFPLFRPQEEIAVEEEVLIKEREKDLSLQPQNYETNEYDFQVKSGKRDSFHN